jgi:hypothetical protein
MSGVLVAGGLGAVATIYASNQNSRAAKDASAGQERAANQANDTQLTMFNQQREDQEPWRQAGADALGQITGNMDEHTRNFSMSDFQQDPGYQFRMDEANKAMERGAAARGGLMGGRAMKEMARYNQDYASGEYQNAYNRYNNDRDSRYNKYAGLAGVGQTANAQMANAGQNYANNYGNNLMGAANAQGAAGMAAANANSQMVGNLANTGMNTWMTYQLMNQNKPKVG